MEGWREERECMILPDPSGGQGLIAGNKEVQLTYFQATQITVCVGPSECPGAVAAHLGKSMSVSLKWMEGEALPSKMTLLSPGPPSVSASNQEWFSTGLLAS